MNRLKLAIIGGFVMGFLLLPGMGRAEDISVGTSTELQEALTHAAANNESDHIFLLAGTYQGPFSYAPAADDPEPYDLIITGAGAEQTILTVSLIDTGRGMRIAGGNGANITVEKLTISQGNASEFSAPDLPYGGGLYVSGDAFSAEGTFTLRDCFLEDNEALKGGGLYAQYPVVVVENNTFRNNRISNMPGDLERGGAGAHVISVDATIRYNHFLQNSSEVSSKGGGLFLKAVGQYLTAASPKVERNLFQSNTLPEGSYGSGAYIFCTTLQAYLQENALISHNRFIENTISGAVGQGGGLYAATYSCYAPLTVVNNVFARNVAPAAGAAQLWPDTATVILTSNTSYSNQSLDAQGDITLNDTMGSKIYNNILWGSLTGDDLKSLGGPGAFFYNNDAQSYLFLADGVNMGNNISEDPGLMDYWIASSDASPSAVVDAGDNNAPGLADFDIEGEPRIILADGTVDIGADEYNSQRPHLWVEGESVLNPSTQLANGFGYSVALDKDTLVVGAPFEDDAGIPGAGAVYIFERNLTGPGAWGLRQRIVSTNLLRANGHFGWSVAIDGKTIVVGEPDYATGRIYIFGSSAEDGWTLEQSFLWPGMDAYDPQKFGYSVAVSKNLIVAGAPFAGFGGEAVIYLKIEGSWLTSPNLILSPDYDNFLPHGSYFESEFGKAVSVSVFPTSPQESECRIMVGAPKHSYWQDNPWGGDRIQDPYHHGTMYTFSAVKYSLPEEETPLNSNLELVDQIDKYNLSYHLYQFGKALSADGKTLLVTDDHLEIFRQANNYWDPFADLDTSADPDYMLWVDTLDIGSVSLDGNWAAIGRPMLSAGSDRGKVILRYRYSSSGSWSTIKILSGISEESPFGRAVAIHGNTLAVAEDDKVRIFEFPNPPIEIPTGYREGAVFPGLIVDGTVENIHVYEYFNRTNQNLICMLQTGSTFKIEAFGPGDDLSGPPRLATEASSLFPLSLEIPAAEAGIWNFKIISLESKDDNPYTFAVMQGDQDGDQVPNGEDNCPAVYNPDQADSDGDGIGDACETTDGDGDGVSDEQDNCPDLYNPAQEDSDSDGTGDVCDACPADQGKTTPGICGCGVSDIDSDGDQVADCLDNCPDTANPNQDDSDGNGIGDVCESTGGDTTPPVIALSVSPTVLWPPNHKMVTISVTIAVTDDLDPAPVWQIESITMNEGDLSNTFDTQYDLTAGDGQTTGDIQVDNGVIQLRAERSGKGDGRVYTITYCAYDSAGNKATQSATVTVPHNL